MTDTVGEVSTATIFALRMIHATASAPLDEKTLPNWTDAREMTERLRWIAKRVELAFSDMGIPLEEELDD